MSSPTTRSLKLMREDGFSAAVVEHWNPHAFIRQDLFGWIDIIAVHPAHPGVAGIQCTSGDNVSARVKKAKGNPALLAWLAAGNSLVVHGWVKKKAVKPDGTLTKREVWAVRTVPVGMEEVRALESEGVAICRNP